MARVMVAGTAAPMGSLTRIDKQTRTGQDAFGDAEGLFRCVEMISGLDAICVCEGGAYLLL